METPTPHQKPAAEENASAHTIWLTRAQTRILREATLLFRQILKGEFRAAARMIREKNRKAALAKSEESPQAFQTRLEALEKGLAAIEIRYTTGRYYNVLQIGPAGFTLLAIERKLKKIMARPTTVSNLQHPLPLSENELRFLGRAAELMARLLMGQIESIGEATAWQTRARMNDVEVAEAAWLLTQYATGLDSPTASHGIFSDKISYKTRWLYDIWHAIQHHLLALHQLETTTPQRIGTEPMPLLETIQEPTP